MIYDRNHKNIEDDKKIYELVQQRTESKMAEIRQMLLPGIIAPLSPSELRGRLFERWAMLPRPEQEKLRLKAAVAMSQLDRLVAELSGYMDGIGDQMKTINRHVRGVTAYGQAGRSMRGASRY